MELMSLPIGVSGVDSEHENDVVVEHESVSSNESIAANLEKKSYAELKKLCREKGLKIAGSKSDLRRWLENPNDPVHQSKRPYSRKS